MGAWHSAIKYGHPQPSCPVFSGKKNKKSYKGSSQSCLPIITYTDLQIIDIFTQNVNKQKKNKDLVINMFKNMFKNMENDDKDVMRYIKKEQEQKKLGKPVMNLLDNWT